VPQFFPRTSTTIARLSLLSIALAVAGVAAAGYLIVQSPYETRQDVPREQPIPFSHEHHAGGLGIDCRYCHTTVEVSSSANIPSTKICMNCHMQMWVVAPDVAPIRESYRSGKSIQWTRVHDLPDFVYFDHSVHVHKGIGCATCHGRVDLMPLTWQAASLRMKWCLDCHRDPAQYVRPRDQVFNMAYTAPPNQRELGEKLVAEYHIVSRISCSTCHR